MTTMFPNGADNEELYHLQDREEELAIQRERESPTRARDLIQETKIGVSISTGKSANIVFAPKSPQQSNIDIV